MGTHPIFESDFDCLTDRNESSFDPRSAHSVDPPVAGVELRNRRPGTLQNRLRPSKHPGWYRYLGFLIMVQAYIPTMIFWNDNNFNERKLEVSILDAIFSEDNFFHDLNLTVVSFTYGWFAWFTGRCMFFHSMNMWNN